MSDLLDLGPACQTTAELVRGVPDAALTSPTPCPGWSVADLLDHLHGLSVAFEHGARRVPLEGDGDPQVDGARLGPDWRVPVPAALTALAEAWRDPAAHEGTAQAGPVQLPARVAAAVALNEVVVHGWDLAVATGQPYAVDPTAVASSRAFAEAFEPPEDGPTDGGSLFGPQVTVADEAPDLHHLVAGTGRDPRWTV
jgi:uncharacterized protein (TIGR03086 family)